MTNEQRNKPRPPATSYYTSTSRKIADFLIGFFWTPVFYFSTMLVLSNLFFTPDTYWYSIGCLCLLIFQWIFFYRRGRSSIVKGGIISVILCWLVLWTGMRILFREPKPIPFDRPVWLTAATSSRTRHTMLTDLLLRHRLVGMSRSEAEELLGKPERVNRYRLAPQDFGVDDIWLELRYKDEKVSGFGIVYD